MNKTFNNFFEKNLNYNYAVKGLTKDLMCIYMIEKFKKNNKPILLITNTIYEASIFYEKFSCLTDNVSFFPMDDFLTSEAIAISPEFKIERITTLNNILNNNSNIVITNLMGLLRILPSPNVFKKNIINIKEKMIYSRNLLIDNLYNLGYELNTLVTKTGEFGIRGFVIDVFPINYDNPIRIEFWDDEIENMKFFDVNSQMSISKVKQIEIIPYTEFLLNSYENINIEDKKNQNHLLKYNCDISCISTYLYDYQTFFFDYNQILAGYENLIKTVLDYNISMKVDIKNEYFLSLDSIYLKNIVYLQCFNDILDSIPKIEYETYDSCYIENYNGDYVKFNVDINMFLNLNKTVVICFNNEYDLKRVIKYLDNKNYFVTNIDEIKKERLNLILFSLSNGFKFDNYVFISQNDLYSYKPQKYKNRYKIGTKIENITNLKKGDYIVHEQFGIGMYDELVTISKKGMKKDFIKLIYKDDDVLYVPVEYINRISKFAGHEGIINLNKLGGKEWNNKKIKVRKKIKELALDLFKLSSERYNSKGYSFNIEDENQLIFENDFPYKETIDQQEAINKIKIEMEKDKPMDMLLCGDVGFGKTEVAFRAMFKAVNNGKQVAYLCPTTILSMQQYNNALERFNKFPINIGLINRFVTPKKQQEVMKDLKDGKIDIIFGTHRLLSDDIEYKDLGFLVVDEEQRFGVMHKEKIKKYKTIIDVLTLSATPIPRTLQMSISGIRSLALIETPPEERYPIQTYLTIENEMIIKDAIYKELSRNGQVFVLSNNVIKMEETIDKFKKILPNVKIKYAHGKMDKNSLESIMIEFVNHKFDVLISSTIIETGIDIPNANTLIVLDADKFGLSQLYQVRGRIGRSNRIGYAYLMYKKGKVLSENATKRLEIIKEFSNLGSGFKIAMQDLSIRGAGSILGDKQSGFIDDIGVDLYLKMLSETVSELKGEIIKKENESNKPLIDVNTYIDDKYINDNDLKIEIHKMISEIDTKEKLINVKKEIEDRFGKINDDLNVYMYEELFESMATDLKITDIIQNNEFIDIKICDDIINKIGIDNLFVISYNISKNFKFKKVNNNIHVVLFLKSLENHFIYYLVNLLEEIKKYF